MPGRMMLPFVVLGILAAPRLAAQCPDGSPPPCRAQPARAAPAPNSVAVLYFDNLSRDTADAYLAEGLTEEIIARLGQMEGLLVKSRNAVQRFRGRTAEDPAVLGRALNVAHLVSGSFRRAGHRLRVTVELVRTASGVRAWGDVYEHADTNLFAIEEDIARAVARATAGRLAPAGQAAVGIRPTRNPEAYEHFLRGNYYVARRTAGTAARGIEEYEAAVRLDPGFTRALARIALGYGLFYEWGWEHPRLPPDSLLARGLAAAERALQQDSTSSDAWLARGYLFAFRYPQTFQGVRAAFERATGLDPRNAEAYHQYGWILSVLGLDSESVAADQRALALEPERPITLSHLAVLSAEQRRFEEALRWLDSALMIDPGFANAYSQRARIRVRLGELAEARADAETAVRLRGEARSPLDEATLAEVMVAQGDTLGARMRVERLLEDLRNLSRVSARQGMPVAGALVAIGHYERALDLLERVRPRGAELWAGLREPGLDPVRAHPRFQRLSEESRPLRAP